MTARTPGIASLIALALAGCNQQTNDELTDPGAMADIGAVKPASDKAPGSAIDNTSEASQVGADTKVDPQPPTMPEALLGQWRENDLGRAPNREDCNQTSTSNRNFGKVLTVRADGYRLFEEGGRIVQVHVRTETTIDATFDTTYADEPTRARKDFVLQSDGALAVEHGDGNGAVKVTEYRSCPTT